MLLVREVTVSLEIVILRIIGFVVCMAGKL